MTKTPNQPNKITCESCGKSFQCGADTGNCWCFSLEITPQNLAQLKEQFQNCLCQECLKKPFIPENTSKG
ncbi:MAG: cysteine-rich CWC family protein [Pyrinomonadaceae bacterium]|nr:cysteine-rich CWC family protein [Pyrinomonadaceae bacterium]